MINLDDFAVDVKAEADGREFTLRCGMVMTIARSTSLGYQQAMRELMEPYLPALRAKKPIGAQVLEDIGIKAMASKLILGWQPVSYKGERFEYSAENAEILLRDERLHDIREEISQIAGSADAFRETLLKESEKN